MKQTQQHPWTIQDVYVLLMKQINTDLLPENLRHLDDLYPHESEKERQLRYKGYKQDLLRFWSALQSFTESFGGMCGNVEKTLGRLIERSEGNIDDGKLQTMFDA